MDALSIRIAGRIKRAVTESRVTYAELATALGRSEATIQRRLNAERAFSFTEVVKAARFLKIPIRELMEL